VFASDIACRADRAIRCLTFQSLMIIVKYVDLYCLAVPYCDRAEWIYVL
jgi:hypothetical protein